MKNKTGIGRRERLYQILQILSKHKITKGLDPIKFRMIIEDLGPTFIKIGQIMSMRSDILPEEYCAELTKLRKDVSAMPYQRVIELLEQEYQKKITDIFASIDETPIGSASIAEAHLAYLKDGHKVVIKIQREGIYEKMSADISLLKTACHILRVSSTTQVIDIEGVLDEIWSVAKEELNFLTEANHIIEFNENNQEFVYVKGPYVYQELTTPRVLVMEYIDGFTIDDKEALQKEEYDTKEIAYKLASNYIHQIVEDGFFHADPHPDNIKICDGKIVYLDFGMMGRLSAHDRNLLKECLRAILKNDIHEIERIFLLVGIHSQRIDYTELYKDLEQLFTKYSTLELQNMNLGDVLMDAFSVAHHYNIAMPKNITMLMRGIVVLEGVLHEIYPELNLIEILKNHVKENGIDALFHHNFMRESVMKLDSIQNGLLNIPAETLTFLKMAVRGETKFNLELTDSQNKIGKLDKMLHRIIVCILDASFILGAALLCLNGNEDTPKLFGYSSIGILFLAIAFLLSIWLLYQMHKDRKKK